MAIESYQGYCNTSPHGRQIETLLLSKYLSCLGGVPLSPVLVSLLLARFVKCHALLAVPHGYMTLM